MYAALKILCRLTILGYFRKVKIEGKEHITKKGPYIFISNHPSAFMDPIVVATSIKPTVYFLAAGEYLGKGLVYWFTNRFLHMIPVYRPSTRPEDTHKNEAIFDKCIEHLNKGRSILVFPEGASVTEKKINPFKTGVARIVRATELSNNLKAGIQIIPIGLNYTDPHQFRSDLFVKIGEPITAADFLTQSKESEQEEVKALTQHMEDELIKTVLHMESDEFQDLLEKINDTFSRDLKSELHVKFKAQDREFELNKLFISAFSFFKNSVPDEYEDMKVQLDNYFLKLETHKISDREVRKVNVKMNAGQILFHIWGAPIFLIGLIGNFIPYRITGMIQRKLNIKDSFKGSISLASGMILFLLWYAALVTIVWIKTPLSFFSLLLPLVLYLSGLLSLLYYSAFGYFRRRRNLRKYLNDHPGLQNEILDDRKNLVARFQALRTRFDAQN